MSLSDEDLATSIQHIMTIQEQRVAVGATVIDLLRANSTLMELVLGLIRLNVESEYMPGVLDELAKINEHLARLGAAYFDANEACGDAVEGVTVLLQKSVRNVKNDFLASVETAGSA